MASGLRQGVPCSSSEKFSVGDGSMGRRVEFEDGVFWVARVRLPVLGGREGMGMKVEVEVGTVRFLRERTTITLPEIYGYNLDPEDGEGGFEIGPELETGMGPWDHVGMYWDTWSHHTMAAASAECEVEMKLDPAHLLPIYFNGLMAAFGRQGQRRFGLVSTGFGAQSAVVDREFNILALVDVDGIMAAPVEWLAQFPEFMGLEMPAPGVGERRSAAVERLRRCEGFLETYKQMIKDAAAERNLSAPMEFADCMLGEGASIVQGLVEYGQHQLSVNQRWMDVYERYMRRIGREVVRAT